MNIFILAAGDQHRWVGSEFKQLVLVPDIPLIVRTFNQFSLFGSVYVVTKHLAIASLFPPHQVIMPADNRFTAATLRSTSLKWRRRTVVLLGDVYYSAQAVETIMTCKQRFAALGSPTFGEIFAFSFTKSSDVRVACRRAIKDAESGGRGKLWEVYRSLSGLPLDEHQYTKLFINIHDGITRDFDKVEQYTQFRADMGWG